jgi:hypothetical protein
MKDVLRFNLSLVEAAQSQLRALHYKVRIDSGIYKTRQVYHGGLPEHGGVLYTETELLHDEIGTMNRHIQLAQDHIEYAKTILRELAHSNQVQLRIAEKANLRKVFEQALEALRSSAGPDEIHNAREAIQRALILLPVERADTQSKYVEDALIGLDGIKKKKIESAQVKALSKRLRVCLLDKYDINEAADILESLVEERDVQDENTLQVPQSSETHEPETWKVEFRALEHDLIQECERAMEQRDVYLKTGVSTAANGGSHDTCFGHILQKHFRQEVEPVGHIYTIDGVQHCTLEKELQDGPLYNTSDAAKNRQLYYLPSEVDELLQKREAEIESLNASGDELRRACAEIIGCDVGTWPDHGNAPLAIAASLAVQVGHIATMRKVLLIALEALENSSDLVFKDVKKSHLRSLAITAIQGVIE